MLHIHDCSEMLGDVKQIGLCAILCNDENITISCLKYSSWKQCAGSEVELYKCQNSLIGNWAV